MSEFEITRRTFLTTGAMATAGMMMSRMPFASAANTGSPNEEINIAIVGFGAQGRVLMQSILNIPGVRIRAICDIWPYAQQYGRNYLKRNANIDINTYVDIEEMLEKEKDLDAAIVATPDFWHAPHTNMCLKAGLNVYCEKMMSNTVEGARSMVKTMDETGKLLQIGHQRKSNPRYLHVLRNLITNAKLTGRLTAASAQWNRAVTDDLGWPKAYAIKEDVLKKYGYKDMHQMRNWRWYKDLSGGPISDLGAHQIDIFAWFLGVRPSTIFASGGTDYYKHHENYDNVMVIYEFPMPEGTARAFYQVQTTTSCGGGYFETFMGDEGSIVISENPRLTKLYREDRAPSWDEWEQRNFIRKIKEAPAAKSGAVDARETAAAVAYEIPVTLSKPIHQPHLENFFDTIRGKAKLTCDGRHAFESEAPIFKVNKAVAARKVLDFTSEDFEC